jgi:hypothetical protein
MIRQQWRSGIDPVSAHEVRDLPLRLGPDTVECGAILFDFESSRSCRPKDVADPWVERGRTPSQSIVCGGA